MIRKLRIAVDHGNKNMKTCNQVFTTALITQDKKPARGEEYIFYEGKYYLLSNRRIPYQRDKTEDERFFILTLFAIVKELKKYPQIAPEDVLQINLPIGLPPKHFADFCYGIISVAAICPIRSQGQQTFRQSAGRWIRSAQKYPERYICWIDPHWFAG